MHNDTNFIRIAKELLAEENLKRPIASPLAEVCNQTNTQFQKLTNVIEAMPEPLELSEESLQQTNPTEINHGNTDILPGTSVPKSNMEYALQFKQSVEIMHWKEGWFFQHLYHTSQFKEGILQKQAKWKKLVYDTYCFNIVLFSFSFFTTFTKN